MEIVIILTPKPITKTKAMSNTDLNELMKRANPLMAHKITVLYKLCQQRGRIIDDMLHWTNERPEKITEIIRIDNMILKVLEKSK